MRNCLDEMRKNAEDWWCDLYYHVVPEIIRHNNLKTGIEIGVAFGGHAEAMLANTDLESLTCIDPWEWTGAEFNCLKTEKDFDKWHEYVTERLSVFGNRVKVARTKSQGYKHVGKVDFVFIDGDHSYQSVRADISKYSKLINKGGILIGHDYGHPDFIGVKVAVDEYVQKNKLELCLFDGYVWSVRL